MQICWLNALSVVRFSFVFRAVFLLLRALTHVIDCYLRIYLNKAEIRGSCARHSNVLWKHSGTHMTNVFKMSFIKSLQASSILICHLL